MVTVTCKFVSKEEGTELNSKCLGKAANTRECSNCRCITNNVLWMYTTVTSSTGLLGLIHVFCSEDCTFRFLTMCKETMEYAFIEADIIHPTYTTGVKKNV